MYSIIMPIYNAEKSIKNAIDSILDQSYKELELICIDDGSNDNSIHILTEYKSKDDRVHIFKQKNAGASAARNKGLELAKGEYILFIDSDDRFHKNTLERIHNVISEEHPEMVCYGYEIFTNDKIKKLCPNKYTTYNKNAILNNEISLISTSYFPSQCNKAYKRSLIEKYNIKFLDNLKYGEDYCFNMEVLCKAEYMIELPECLYTYYVSSSNSITNKYDPDKVYKLMELQKQRAKLLMENKVLDPKWLNANIRSYAIRYCYSSFMDLFRPECSLNFKDKILFIKKVKKDFNCKFVLSDNKYLTNRQKLYNTIFWFNSVVLIYATSLLFYEIKRKSSYGSKF